MDFEQRFNASRWAEDRLLDALNNEEHFAVRIGLSQVAQDNVIRDGGAAFKVPDLLLFRRRDLTAAQRRVLSEGDLTQLTDQDLGPETELGKLIRMALAGIEVEFSPYRAAEMSGRGWRPKSREAIEARSRIADDPQPPVAPNIFVKYEDLQPLLEWQNHYLIPVLVVHVFDQEAFAIRLEALRRFRMQLSGNKRRDSILQQSTGIFTKMQNYGRVDAEAAGERKPVLMVTPAAAIKVGDVLDVKVTAQLGLSSSKKYVTQALFSGGRIALTDEFRQLLNELR